MIRYMDIDIQILSTICITMVTTKTFDVLNVSFYGVYIVITFLASNWTICSNAYRFKSNAWAHVKGAKQWLNDHPLNHFYSAIKKVELAWQCERIDRREWSLRCDIFYYSKWIGGNKRDCYFNKKMWLFA